MSFLFIAYIFQEYIPRVMMSVQHAGRTTITRQYDSENVSPSENNYDTSSYAEGRDHNVSSDGGIHYKFTSLPPILMVEPNRPELPSVSGSKIMTRRTSAAQIVPVSAMGETGNNNAGASVKPVAIPKKRRYLDTVAESNSAREKSTSEMRSILIIKNPVEEVNHELASEESGNKPEDATIKLRKTVTWAIDSPSVKKGRQHAKKHPRKANSIDKPPLEKGHRDVKKQPKIISVPPSTSVVTDKKLDCVNVLPLTDGPPANKVSSKKPIEKNRFWAHTLASDFDSSDYEMLLKKCHFTEEQTDVIKRSFNLLCRKQYIVSTYTDRFMKTHMCIDCQFSISHQCVSVHFSQFVRSNGNVVSTTPITPESMNICTCGFGFFHSHATNSRIKLSDNLSSMNISCLYEHDRSTNVSCPKCHINIVIKNRNNNICSDLTNWVDLYGALNRQFYNFLNDHLERSSMHKPNLDELYTCRRRCCQIFHRCPNNAAPYGDNAPQLSPGTTYTCTLITGSND